MSLAVGWIRRNEEYLTPKYGLGYWLGIVGGVMMLLLLFYSYRKRKPMLRSMGSIPTWFRVHMLLGIFGPVLVVFHSNFQLGALNSNVALFTMLTVAGSGVIGRYIYGKIHIGLYGRKAVVNDILVDIEKLSAELGHELEGMGDIVSELKEFRQETVDAQPTTALSSLFRGAALSITSRIHCMRFKSRVRALLAAKAKAEGWSQANRRRTTGQIKERSTRISALS